MTEAETYLRLISDHFGNAHAKFILAHGRAWEPTAQTFKGWRGKQKECFGNAAKLVLREPSLTYVEGYATAIIPFHHAWCVTPDGTIVEPTLRIGKRDKDHLPRGYFGVPFDWEFVCAYLTEVQTFGLLDGMSKKSIDLQTGKIPPEEFLCSTSNALA